MLKKDSTGEGKAKELSQTQEIQCIEEELKKANDRIIELEEETVKLRTSLYSQLSDNTRIVQIAEKEKSQQANRTRKELALQLIPVADDLDRAFLMLKDVDTDASCKAPVEYILNSLVKAFESIGLTVENPLGKTFDPHRFELGGQLPSEGETDTVCKVLRKGYVLYGEVIRPALVVCSMAKKENNNQEEENE